MAAVPGTLGHEIVHLGSRPRALRGWIGGNLGTVGGGALAAHAPGTEVAHARTPG